MGGSFQFMVKNNSAYDMTLYVDTNNANCVDTEFCQPPPFLGTSTTIKRGGSSTWLLYHKTGHGCDGTQAVFQAQPIFSIASKQVTGKFQGFQYDNNGGAAFNGCGVDYGSEFSQAASGAVATWTITVFGP